MARLLISTLLISIVAACGVAAGPLATRGTSTTPGVAAQYDDTRAAAFVCFGGRFRALPADVVVVTRYRDCQIVLTPDAEHEQLWTADLRLGPAAHLRKIDPAALVKALATFERLHLVIEPSPDAPSAYGRLDLVERVACRQRGIARDLSCPPESVPLLLAHEDVRRIEVFNRHGVRWK